jgi:hypothetical protein
MKFYSEKEPVVLAPSEIDLNVTCLKHFKSTNIMTVNSNKKEKCTKAYSIPCKADASVPFGQKSNIKYRPFSIQHPSK